MNGTPSEAELHVWSGDFGLPTVFPDSLQIVLHLKISNKTFKLIEKRNPVTTPDWGLPYFKHGNVELNDFDKIVHYLNKNFSIDSNLSSDEQCLAYTYINYVNSVLRPCFQYAWWVDEKNYDESVRPWFAKSITLPFNFYYPGQYRKRAQQEVEVVYGDYLTKNELYVKVYKIVEKFFLDISDRLGRNEFFMGKKISSVDTVLYSYLAPILKFPLINPTITNYLKSHNNLLKYIQRLSSTYFSDIERKYIDAQEKKRLTQHQTDIQKKESYNIQNKIFAILIAGFAMFGFARSNGLLGRNSSDPTSDYDFSDGDDDYRL